MIRLSLVRGILALAWALAFAAVHHPLNTVAVVLLVAYPLIDAVSCAIDYRTVPDGSERRVTALNGILSTLTAIAVGVAGVVGGEGAVLGVFGAWAILSGAAQLAVGIRRRGPVLGKQWPTLISGGLSFLVGAIAATALLTASAACSSSAPTPAPVAPTTAVAAAGAPTWSPAPVVPLTAQPAPSLVVTNHCPTSSRWAWWSSATTRRTCGSSPRTALAH